MTRNFNSLFDEWSSSYDETVAGDDPEYNEVFRNYSHILEEVANRSDGHIIEFGVGTGNLTSLLIKQGHQVCGIEPSKGMREIARRKLPTVQIIEGDFLHFVHPFENIDTIVSTYAFHHLTDEEKGVAVQIFSEILSDGGKVVFADTVFESEEAQIDMIQSSEDRGYHRLANDLKTEFYTTIPIMKGIFEKNGFSVTFMQKNDFVWIIEAIK